MEFLIIATSFRKPVPHAMFNFLIYIEDEQKGTGGNTYAMGIYIINRNRRNIHNLAISVSYGLKLKRIPFLYNFVISLISIVFAFVSISAGSFLSHYFSQSIANFTGGFLITALGIWFIITISNVC